MEAGISTTTFIDTRFYLGTLAADRTVCPRPTTPLKLQLSHHARVLSCSLLFLSPFCVRENDVVCLKFIYLSTCPVCLPPGTSGLQRRPTQGTVPTMDFTPISPERKAPSSCSGKAAGLLSAMISRRL